MCLVALPHVESSQIRDQTRVPSIGVCVGTVPQLCPTLLRPATLLCPGILEWVALARKFLSTEPPRKSLL